MSIVPPKFPELVNGSDYVVRTVVKSVRSEWQERQGKRHIYTLVELNVLEVIAGVPPSPLVLHFLGGQVGGEAMVIEGAPQFAIGQEDILFVRGNGRQFSPLTAVTYGRYPVMRDRTTGRDYMVRSNGVPLRDSTEVSEVLAEGQEAEMQKRMAGTSQALTPAAFIQQIRAAMGATIPAARVK